MTVSSSIPSSTGSDSARRVNKNRSSAIAALVGIAVAEIVLLLIWLNISDNFWIPPNIFRALMALLVPVFLFVVVDAIWGVKGRSSKAASYPMMLIVLGVFVGGTIWTVLFSFTNIKILPLFTPRQWIDGFVGMKTGPSRWCHRRTHPARSTSSEIGRAHV